MSWPARLPRLVRVERRADGEDAVEALRGRSMLSGSRIADGKDGRGRHIVQCAVPSITIGEFPSEHHR
jgi:hypothetical protein